MAFHPLGQLAELLATSAESSPGLRLAGLNHLTEAHCDDQTERKGDARLFVAPKDSERWHSERGSTMRRATTQK